MGHQVKRRDGTVASIDKRRGFVDYYRNPDPYRDPLDRVFDWNEIRSDDGHDEVERKVQAARCMDCGTPFCQTHTGCPVNNLIPEWNELVFKDQWKEAIDRYAWHFLSLTIQQPPSSAWCAIFSALSRLLSCRLHHTNNFPEFTGLVCPAPCEGACVAGLVDSPVTIKNIEYSIVERAWEEGWITPRIPSYRSGMSVAVVGSGPAGASLFTGGGYGTHAGREGREGARGVRSLVTCSDVPSVCLFVCVRPGCGRLPEPDGPQGDGVRA